ncbi:hypothetical protein [Xanthomonas massiliensis]|uniref:hypothetical protein n=1 Tax=Xanthomonas massiliensis TaxID=1720302 RepID=UPI000ACE5EBE|nr:hypothetical protein [Xanthomonas massiliensis]
MHDRYQSGYNAGRSQAQADQTMRDFLARERAAGRGLTPEGITSLFVLALCVAIPVAVVGGLRVWLGEWSYFVEHPMVAKWAYGVVAVFLFSACYTFHRVILRLLAAAFFALLFFGFLGWIVVLVLDGIH